MELISYQVDTYPDKNKTDQYTHTYPECFCWSNKKNFFRISRSGIPLSRIFMLSFRLPVCAVFHSSRISLKNWKAYQDEQG